MESLLFCRIKELCSQRGISISKLESELGLSSSSIRKWGNTSSPSVDKIAKVANYFNVSVDYLLGRTDIPNSISEIVEDKEIVSLQRARQRMSVKDRERMMQMLRIGFDYAFEDEGKNE